MPRRDRWTLLAQTLDAIETQRVEKNGKVLLTDVALRTKVPYDRLMLYLEEMAQAGLVTRERPPRITPQGYELLARYKKWKDVLSRFGLE